MRLATGISPERSPALAPPPGNPRFELMDACRGLAALAVVVAHAYGPAAGVSGNLVLELASAVQLFFAISGFLLLRPFLAAWASGRNEPRIRDFLQRRALRILPAYWVALTVTALVLGPVFVAGVFTSHWWIYYGFLQVYSLQDVSHGIAPAWSLCVEMTFYLLLPLLVIAIRRLIPRLGWQRASLAVIGPLLVVGPVVHLLNATPFGRPTELLFQHMAYTLPGEINYFGAGMLLAVASVHLQHGGRLPRPLGWLAERPGDAWSLAVLAYILAAVLGGFASPLSPPGIGPLNFRTRFVANDLLVWMLVVLLLIPAVFSGARRSLPKRILSARWLTYVGVVSYGLYIFHAPLGQWVFSHWGVTERLPTALGWPLRAAILLPVGLLAGTISYRLVELPFLRLKNGWRRQPQPQRAVEPEPLPAAVKIGG